MNLIVTENALIKIECNESVGMGKVNQGTINLSGPFTGTCTLNPTYAENTTIDGGRVLCKLSMSIIGAMAGYTPTAKGNGSFQGTTQHIKESGKSFVLDNQMTNLTNGSCTSNTTPTTVLFYTATVSFLSAGQVSTYGE